MARGPRLIRAKEAAVRQAEENLSRLQAEIRRLQVSIDEKQLNLKAREESVKKRRIQLMEAKSNREYQLLLDQIRADEMANSTLADEILEEMERLDQLKATLSSAKEEVAKAKEELDRTREAGCGHGKRNCGPKSTVCSRIARSGGKLPEDCRELYDRVVRAKGEDALAPVDGQYCGGCHQQVPLNSINALATRTSRALPRCGRLLYVPENYNFR